MNNEEYIVISKSKILERIEELRNMISYAEREPFKGNIYAVESLELKILQLEQILSNSTPLIPEIETAWEHGYTRGYNLAYCEWVNSDCFTPSKQDYISNLKLNI